MPGRTRIQYLTNITTVLVLPCVGLRHRPDIGGAWMGQRPHSSSSALRFFWTVDFSVSVHSVSPPLLAQHGLIRVAREAVTCDSFSHGVWSKLVAGLPVSALKPASLLLVLKAVPHACEEWQGGNFTPGDLLNPSPSWQLYTLRRDNARTGFEIKWGTRMLKKKGLRQCQAEGNRCTAGSRDESSVNQLGKLSFPFLPQRPEKVKEEMRGFIKQDFTSLFSLSHRPTALRDNLARVMLFKWGALPQTCLVTTHWRLVGRLSVGDSASNAFEIGLGILNLLSFFCCVYVCAWSMAF